MPAEAEPETTPQGPRSPLSPQSPGFAEVFADEADVDGWRLAFAAKQRLSVKRDEDVDKEPTYALSCRCGTFKWTIPKLPFARFEHWIMPSSSRRCGRRSPSRGARVFYARRRPRRPSTRGATSCRRTSERPRFRTADHRSGRRPRRVGGDLEARRSETEHRRRRRGPRETPTPDEDAAAAGDEH